jgi:hypothetical protein
VTRRAKTRIRVGVYLGQGLGASCLGFIIRDLSPRIGKDEGFTKIHIGLAVVRQLPCVVGKLLYIMG